MRKSWHPEKYIILALILSIIFSLTVFFPYDSGLTLTPSELPAAASINNWEYSGDSAVSGGSVIVANKSFPFFKKKVKVVPEVQVFAGGIPIGFYMKTRGVLIINNPGVVCDGVKVNPGVEAGIRVGDILMTLDGKPVNSIEDIQSVISQSTNADKQLDITFKRKNKDFASKIKAVKDETGAYKLGLWIRDNAAGIGTLTYMKKENGHFGALGHPICDDETGTSIPLSDGKVFDCTIIGITKGQKGTPGELRGVFLKSSEPIGKISLNNKFGVFGKIDNYSASLNPGFAEPLAVANRSSITPGKAQLLTTVDDTPKCYDIEIVKTSYQKTKDHKSMIIRVTDKELLARTGGIVQGMSGSPIIQGGKLVGAITHVFVNDPTRGYAVYLDWMYNEY